MTKLEELINELCPDCVEYRKLADVCNFNRGTSLVSKNAKSGDIPVISGGQKPAFYHNEANRTGTTITVAGSGAYAGYVSIWYEPIFVCDAFSVEPKNADELDIKYLYHYLTNNQKKIYNKKTGAGIPHVHGKDIAKFSIPLPPLSIQSEIVHILDSFTLLTAELTAELTARQKQYAFYRDYLLDFSNEDVTKKIPDIDCSQVKTLRLDEVAQIYDGTHQTPNYKDSGIPFISVENIKDIYGSKKYISEEDFNKYKIKPQINDVFMTRIGSIGDCAILDKQADLAYYVSLALIRPNTDIVISKYLKYVIESRFGRKELRKRTLVNAVPIKINKNDIGKIELPIPPLSVQKNIVKILDRFDKLYNDMSEGLPAEIAARKKQYEYYRDTLLSFDDKACSQIVKVERERELTRIKAIKWLKLKELAHYSTDRIDSSKLDENTYVGVDNLLQNRAGKKLAEHIPTSGRCTKYICNDILIGNIRPYLKKIWFANNDGGTNGDVLDIRVNDYSVLYPRYLYYVLSSDKFFNYDMQNAKGAKMPRGSKDAVMNYPIPVPPLEEQERIVSILDRFDKLCNDISEGLPAEIEARQKQYEYYRDKLLMFKSVEANEK